jgi:lipopolysaccharide transport system ATP-binding protein
MGYLRVCDLGKAYKRYPAKWGRLAEWMGLGSHHDLNWVVRDVSFDVAPGEASGIVGSNGAGKITLLTMASGKIRTKAAAFESGGRVAALLELGIGFHPEFTGTQNVYMAGHILGIPAERIGSLMEEIKAFAEIGDYMDQAVRTYSSGMQVRLAFSVATAVRPDILIVDEALSVGDAYFQHKSFARIRHFREQGTTLLFVSHDPAAVKTLCDRALLMDAGILIRDGAPDAVLDYYNAMIAVKRADSEIVQTERETGVRMTRSGSGSARIASVELRTGGDLVRAIRSGESVSLEVSIDVNDDLPELTVGMLIRDRLGNDVFGTNTLHLGESLQNVRAGRHLTAEFEFSELRLGVGNYSVTIALHAGHSHVTTNYDWWDRVLAFQVVPGLGPQSIGTSNLPLSFHWDRLREAPAENRESSPQRARATEVGSRS